MTGPGDPEVVVLQRPKRTRSSSIELLIGVAALALLAGPLLFLFFTSMHW
jgi:hypothetical protein